MVEIKSQNGVGHFAHKVSKLKSWQKGGQIVNRAIDKTEGSVDCLKWRNPPAFSYGWEKEKIWKKIIMKQS